jgi:hypothetical protein
MLLNCDHECNIAIQKHSTTVFILAYFAAGMGEIEIFALSPLISMEQSGKFFSLYRSHLVSYQFDFLRSS